MRTFIMLAVCLLAALPQAWAASADLKPSKLSATVAPSVVTPASHAAQTASQKSDLQDGTRAWRAGHYTAAFAVLKPLATQGNAAAQYLLGSMYAHGQGVPQNYTKAVYWYRKAAAQGNAFAEFNLGVAYFDGQGVPQDYTQAVYWFRKAAAQGHARAESILGVAYFDGQGVPQNYTKAVYWYRKAAAQGNAFAEFFLGGAYVHGQGVPQNYTKAVYWLRKAAAQGGKVGREAHAAIRYIEQHHSANSDYAECLRNQKLAIVMGEPPATCIP